MTRTSIGLSLAAAAALAVSLGAQTTTTTSQQRPSMDHDRDNIAVTGCLERDANGGFSLSNAHIDTSASPSTTTAGAATTTGTSGTTGTSATTTTTTTEPGSVSATRGATWKLEGASSELERHIGHKVTVSGREVPSSSSSGATSTTTTGTTATTGTTGTTAVTGEDQKRSTSAERRLDVQSVKMISSSCS